MIKIYHNNRCSKSREGLCLLESLNQPIEVINYLENPPTIEDIKLLIEQLGIKPLELVRVKENIWIENFKGKNLSNDEIIKALHENPKLIERPIVINKGKAVIARPTEKINEIL